MSENTPKYEVAGRPSLPEDVLAPFTDPHHRHPSNKDVRTLKEISGLSENQLADLVGIKGGGRQFRKWTAPADTSNHRTIPYSAWRLLLIELNLVAPHNKG